MLLKTDVQWLYESNSESERMNTMKKTKLIKLILIIAVLILEIIPYGAVCNFMGDPEANIKITYTYSYFDLTPFGYANFGPLLTAILTCILTVLILVSNFSNKNMHNSIGLVAILATVTSVLPLLYGNAYYNIVSFLITALHIAILMIQHVEMN